MEEQVPWVIAEAEAAVFAKYNAITAAQEEYETNKRDMIFHGSLGGLCGAAALAMQDAEFSGQLGLRIGEYVDEVYGASGAVFIGLAVHALCKSLKSRREMIH